VVPATDYIRDPDRIYRESFATIRREADLSRFSGDMEEVAVRLIHACGMVDIVDDLVMSPDAVDAGRAALARGCGVFCDAEMVRHGIIARRLPGGVDVHCQVGAPQTAETARALSTTRSAAAFENFGNRLDGAVVAVGNAPTALFHLLEMIARGVARPSLIVATPVGFVGAAESKDALIADPRGIPFITVRGRRGGSAMAASIINAIAGGLTT
jgi:precorrin-8X/cobalt-precorrin-8 methylmutase